MINTKILYIVIFISYFLLVHNNSQSQKNYFILSGTVKNLKSGYIELETNSPSIKVKSYQSKIVNFQFKFKGSISQPDFIYLTFKSTQSGETDWFFLDRGSQKVEIILYNGMIKLNSTSISNKENEKLNEKLDSINKYDNQELENENSEILSRMLIKPTKNKDLFLYQYVTKNKASFAGINKLSYFVYKEGYKLIYDSIYSSFDKKLKISNVGLEIKNKLEMLSLLSKDSIFPSFKLHDLNNKIVNLSEVLSSKFTLVDFWFSSCTYCIQLFPKLKDIYSKYQGKGFQIISISTDLKKFESDWKNAIRKYDLPWPQYIDQNHIQSTQLNINTFPTSFLLNSEGKIISYNIELNELDSLLLKTLN